MHKAIQPLRHPGAKTPIVGRPNGHQTERLWRKYSLKSDLPPTREASTPLTMLALTGCAWLRALRAAYGRGLTLLALRG